MNILLKGLIIYIVVTIAIRLMGKRQIGELQPAELVITVVLSQIATMPLQNKEFPMINGIALMFLFVMLELVSSFLAMKFRPYRNMMQGNSVLIIKDGHLLQKNLAMIRYSIDDLLEALRLKDVFDISQVQYAYIETNGSVSIKLKKKADYLTSEDMNIECTESTLPCLVISDGKVITRDFPLCNMTKEKIEKLLKKSNLSVTDVFIMTADSSGNTNIIRKDNKK